MGAGGVMTQRVNRPAVLYVHVFTTFLCCLCTEPEVKEAVALHDFEGRSGRELSFKKGEVLVLYTQASHDWWEGCCHGQEGLIPDKYIAVKQAP